MDSFMPPKLIQRFVSSSDRATPQRLDQISYSINRMNDGALTPFPVYPDTYAINSAQVIFARLQIPWTAPTPVLSGLYSIDGVTPSAGDVVLVAWGSTPALYAVASSSWNIISYTSDLTPGTLISVWDGQSSPVMYSCDTFGSNECQTVSGVQRFQISSISYDYLVCKQYSAQGIVINSPTINVARPYLLRSLSSWNGISYSYTGVQNRTATQGPNTENQVVVPAYVVGDEIQAIAYPQGSVGTVHTAPGVGTIVIPVPVYLDANVDARAWAKVAT